MNTDILLLLSSIGVSPEARHTTLVDAGYSELRAVVKDRMYYSGSSPLILRLHSQLYDVVSDPGSMYAKAALAFNLLVKEMALRGESMYVTDLVTLTRYITAEDELFDGVYSSIERCTFLAVADMYQVSDARWVEEDKLPLVASWIINSNRRGKGFVFLSQTDMCTPVSLNDKTDSVMWPVGFRAYLQARSLGFVI